jgi:murein DD-endopeptidase MepM/ murein hydrolase activator NlpD
MHLVPKRVFTLLAMASACLIYQGVHSASASASPTLNARFAPLPKISGELSLKHGMWHWPVKPAVVESVFRQPNSDWGAGHRGIDLIALPAAPLLAPTSARVAFAGPVFGRPVVTLLNDQGLTLEFEPACLPNPPALDTTTAVGVAAELLLPQVRVGQNVSAGQIFGVFCPVGLATHCPATCLHWGVRTEDGGYLSAQRFLNRLAPARPKAIGV